MQKVIYILEDVVECGASTCLSGGTCVELVGGGNICECPPGFTGSDCCQGKLNVKVINISKVEPKTDVRKLYHLQYAAYHCDAFRIHPILWSQKIDKKLILAIVFVGLLTSN